MIYSKCREKSSKRNYDTSNGKYFVSVCMYIDVLTDEFNNIVNKYKCGWNGGTFLNSFERKF